MKKNYVKLAAFCAILSTTSFLFSACNDDDDDPVVEPVIDPVVEPEIHVAYILNEGSYKANNSTLDVYYPNGESTYVNKFFANANGEVIGDTGQDLIKYGDYLYLSVFGSNYLAKLQSDGKIVEKYEFTESDGSPRSLVAYDGNIYVTLYSGQVAKFDTASISSPKGFVAVGNNPEGMAVSGSDLVVCNSQKDYVNDNRISIVDLNTFTLKKNIEIEYGNFLAAAVIGDNVYVTYYTPSYSIHVLNLDIDSEKVSDLGTTSKLAVYDGELYCANSETVYDENWNATTNTSYFKRNITNGTKTDLIDITGNEELATATVYLFNVDPQNGDIYIGTTDYKTNGTIYRFDKDGKFITKFTTSGINPSHIVFN